MITRQEVEQMVYNAISNYDFSCYPMSCDNFQDLITDELFSLAKFDELELEAITQEMFDEADNAVCREYTNQGLNHTQTLVRIISGYNGDGDGGPRDEAYYDAKNAIGSMTYDSNDAKEYLRHVRDDCEENVMYADLAAVHVFLESKYESELDRCHAFKALKDI